MVRKYGLSDREEIVAHLLMEGKSNKQIATALKISSSTVEFHLTNLYAKLGVGSRSEAIILLSHLGKTPGPEGTGGTPKNMDASEENPGKFPVGNGAGKANNEGSSKPPSEEAPAMNAQTNQPLGSYRALLVVIAILFVVIIFGGFLLLESGANRQLEKVEVTRLVTHEVTRMVRVTRLVKVTPTFTKAPPPAEPAIEIMPGITLPDTIAAHSLTRLLDGRVLIAGGSRSMDQFVDHAAIYDPVSNVLTPVAPLPIPRHRQSATLLEDGRVLVVGGYTTFHQWLTDAAVYDPTANTWTVIPPHYSHGVSHTATLMKDGRVLVVGGCIGDSVCTDKVEIFDPYTDSWSQAASLKSTRASQTAQLLKDGRVLIAGGDWLETNRLLDGSAAIYDPQTDSWTATAPMVTRRVQAESVLLPNGDVLVAGGYAAGVDPPRILHDTEIYDPVADTWTQAADLSEPRFLFVMALLPDGHALVVGGARDINDRWNENSFVRQVEMYDPATNRWQVVGEIERPTAYAAAVLLTDGRLWVTGGQAGHTIFYSDTWTIQLNP
jgi:DNA-binding CsgD family transcriptional regulator/N-acetylneuraminic acid mutarotase